MKVWIFFFNKLIFYLFYKLSYLINIILLRLLINLEDRFYQIKIYIYKSKELKSFKN